MNITHFKNFIVLAEERSIARAARVLFMSTSTLSKQLIALENEIGLTLFKRDTNPLVLTHAGMLFLETALEVVGETRELEKKLTDLSESVKGHIQLGVTSLRVECDFQEILPRFLEKHPNCCVDLTESTSMDMRDMLLSGELDIAVCSDNFHSDLLAYDCIAREEMLIMVSEKHRLAARAGRNEQGRCLPCKPQWFENESFILQSKRSPSRTYFSDFFKRVPEKPNVSITGSSSTVLLRMAAATNYCTIGSEYYFRHFPQLVGFSFDPPIYQNFAIARRMNYKYNRQEQDLVDTIREFYWNDRGLKKNV